MKFAIRFLVGLAVVGVLSTLLVVQVRYLLREWWAKRAVRRAVYGLPVTLLVTSLAWLLGISTQTLWLGRAGATLTAICLLVMLGLLLALPCSALLMSRPWRWPARWRARRRRSQQDAVEADESLPDPARRRVLTLGAAAFPTFALGSAAVGVARSYGRTDVSLRRLRYRDLPAPLHGLRILHVTDVHLGIYKDLDDLAAVVSAARPLGPDLVVLTGDIADDLGMLPEALGLCAGLAPRYGVYSSLGNHEYYRGIEKVKQAHAASSVRLLRDAGVLIDVKGQPLWVGGVDDPRRMHKDNRSFLQRSVDRALSGRPPGAFTVLLSHRPEGFVPASARAADLTLAGHTHGGQVGVGGRSLWRIFAPKRYLWGRYRRGPAQMYLSAGVGHWFPFRLGCPTEAPVLELRPK